jgi:hypothetical protein
LGRLGGWFVVTFKLTHNRAVFLMVVVALMWSTAGVVTRHLDAARSFEVTFWRALFTRIVLAGAASGYGAADGSLPTSAMQILPSGFQAFAGA